MEWAPHPQLRGIDQRHFRAALPGEGRDRQEPPLILRIISIWKPFQVSVGRCTLRCSKSRPNIPYRLRATRR